MKKQPQKYVFSLYIALLFFDIFFIYSIDKGNSVKNERKGSRKLIWMDTHFRKTQKSPREFNLIGRDILNHRHPTYSP